MNMLIDANILLDVLQERKPHVQASSLIWKLCETGQAHGTVCAFSFLNLVYIMRKELDARSIQSVLEQLDLIFDFADLQIEDIEKAAALAWPDYEDAVQYATADRICADVIITRNVRDYKDSRISVMTPEEYLKNL